MSLIDAYRATRRPPCWPAIITWLIAFPAWCALLAALVASAV